MSMYLAAQLSAGTARVVEGQIRMWDAWDACSR